MKEDKIEVGEYVRTYNGNIFKITGGNLDNYDIDINYYTMEFTEPDWLESNLYNDNGYFFDEKHIKKHSKNIIDLIEYGDYVNGYYVIDDAKKDKKYITIAVNYREYGEEYLKNKEIESVVTKEQFKSMEYRLED